MFRNGIRTRESLNAYYDYKATFLTNLNLPGTLEVYRDFVQEYYINKNTPTPPRHLLLDEFLCKAFNGECIVRSKGK